MADRTGTFWTELCDLMGAGFTGCVVLRLDGGAVREYDPIAHEARFTGSLLVHLSDGTLMGNERKQVGKRTAKVVTMHPTPPELDPGAGNR